MLNIYTRKQGNRFYRATSKPLGYLVRAFTLPAPLWTPQDVRQDDTNRPDPDLWNAMTVSA